MKLSQWRIRLQNWLQTKVTVDSWALDRPNSTTETMGFLPPIRETQYTKTDLYEFHVEFLQDFFLVKRLPGTYGYKDLIVNVLEGIHASLNLDILRTYQDIHVDVLDMGTDLVLEPVKISEIGEEDGDWLATLQWTIKVKLKVDHEAGVVNSPIQINSVIAYVWDSKLKEEFFDGANLANRTLDFTYKTP